MCGRVVATAAPDFLAAWLWATPSEVAPPPPSWNLAPGALLPVVAAGRSGRRLGAMRWGLVPSWSADPTRGPRPINARAETIAERPAFAGPFARRRCVVPVDGYYEWRRDAGGRRPHYVSRIDGSPLALAGVWDRWEGAGADGMTTCAIVTTSAGDDVAGLHHRMPVSLSADNWDRWLDRSVHQPAELLHLLGPAPAGTLCVREVGPRVNSARHDDPDLLARCRPTQLRPDGSVRVGAQ